MLPIAPQKVKLGGSNDLAPLGTFKIDVVLELAFQRVGYEIQFFPHPVDLGLLGGAENQVVERPVITVVAYLQMKPSTQEPALVLVLEGKIHSPSLGAHERVWEDVAESCNGAPQVRVLTFIIRDRASASLFRDETILPEDTRLGGRIELRYQRGGEDGYAFGTFLDDPIPKVLDGEDGAFRLVLGGSR